MNGRCCSFSLLTLYDYGVRYGLVDVASCWWDCRLYSLFPMLLSFLSPRDSGTYRILLTARNEFRSWWRHDDVVRVRFPFFDFALPVEQPTIIHTNFVAQKYNTNYLTMKLKLTPTALALASTTSIFVQSSSISNAGEVRLSHRPKDITDKIKYRRRAERKPILGISTGGGNAEVDVGILAGDDGHRQHDAIPLFGRTRFLQEDQPTCSYPDTCEPNLCACTAKGQYAYDCAAELNAVCNKVYDANGKVWTLDGCTGDVEYYANTYCPFVKCIVEGGTYGACSCQFYQTVCNLYGDRQKYEVSPFFRWGVGTEPEAKLGGCKICSMLSSLSTSYSSPALSAQ